MSATVPFWKMHGTGNDFVVFDGADLPQGTDLAALGERLCDRHFGIGADGLLIRWPSETGDARMQIINCDGSEAKMCGNGIRCVAVYLRTHGNAAEALTIETLGGMIRPTHVGDGLVRVAMGRPRLQASEIPVTGYGGGQVVDAPIQAGGHDYRMTTVSMGNPHAVIFIDSLAETAVAVDGAGLTMACGTGACATVVAGVLTGRLDREVAVSLPGGVLQIAWPADDAEVIMTGPAEMVFAGTFSV